MTPHRIFQDADETTWTAWDVIPNWGERRQTDRRAAAAGPPAGFRDRRRNQRRTIAGIRIALSPRLSRGWLAFESGTARRRLAPIPDGWQSLPDGELRTLLHRAEHVAAKRRRLIE